MLSPVRLSLNVRFDSPAYTNSLFLFFTCFVRISWTFYLSKSLSSQTKKKYRKKLEEFLFIPEYFKASGIF